MSGNIQMYNCATHARIKKKKKKSNYKQVTWIWLGEKHTQDQSRQALPGAKGFTMEYQESVCSA